MRREHKLKPTIGTSTPKRLIFFDTETIQTHINEDTIHQHLRLGYGAFCKRVGPAELQVWRDVEFTTQDEFWTWVDEICTSRSTTYLIAHNIVFDLTVMGAFQALPALGWELESFYSKGLVSMFRWSKDGRRIAGLDSSNLFPGTLKSWGDRLDLPKLDIDFDDTDDDSLMIYCRRDVDIMVRAFETWLTFLGENDCGAFKPTIASTAFNTWRHKHLTHTVHIHTDEKALHLEREAYRGGRTECLWVGRREDGPFYYLDVNNMYGFVLQNYEYPARLWGTRASGDLYRLAYKLKRYAVIARVRVNVSEGIYPIDYNEHACYPLGRFETVLTTPELKYALERDWIEEVYETAWYRKQPLFESYIKDFRELRTHYQDTGQEGFEKIVKLLINGLYGKFGQRKLSQKVIGSCDPNIFRREQVYDAGEKEYYDQIWLGGTIFRERQSGESYHSFPAIAAHVTAYARLYLTWFLNRVPAGHVFYMDTDSLVVDQAGFDALRFYVDTETIGMLKVELTSPWLEINAPKDYAMESRHRLKGIKSNAVEVEDGVFEQWIWPGLNGIIQAGAPGPYTMRKIRKRRTGRIWSGIKTASGWIDPFHFSDGVPAPRELSLQPPELL